MRTLLLLTVLAALPAARYAVVVEWQDGVPVASPPALALAEGDTLVLVARGTLAVALGESLGGGRFVLSPAADAAMAARGEELRLSATPIPCLTCHSVDGTEIIAPSWLEALGAERLLASGDLVLFDYGYFVKSVRDPAAMVACKTEGADGCAAGWPPTMPPVYTTLPDDDIDALFNYIRSLSSVAATWSAEPATGTHAIGWEGGGLKVVVGAGTGLLGGGHDDAWALLARARSAQLRHDQGEHALFEAEMAELASGQSDAALATALQAAAGHDHTGDHTEVAALLEMLVSDGALSLATATMEQLDSLPGIGPVKAQAILDARAAGGLTVATLTSVKGIGDATLAKILPFLRD